MVLGLEGSVAGSQSVDCDSQGPNVHSLVVPAAEVDLGGEVKVGADDGQHVSPHSPRKSLLRNPEVYDFDFALLLVVENVLGFDIAVADVVFVEVLQTRDQLPNHYFQLSLGMQSALGEVGEREVFHDQKGETPSAFEVERFVAADGFVAQFFNVNKIPF